MTRTSRTFVPSATRSTTSSPSWVEVLVSSSTAVALEERLGYRFGDPALLDTALAHRSWCSEHPGEASNERLEFLGDAVLGVVVTDHLYRSFPDQAEGQLAKTRAAVVSAASLAEVGRSLELGDHIRLGKGEAASGGGDKSSILSDAVEAVIGAIYLDGGLDPARDFVMAQLEEPIAAAATTPGGGDYKTRLQELAAAAGEGPPAYQLSESGPDHLKRFEATVTIGGAVRGTGDGSSKKEAEQRAARAAWDARSAEDGASDV
ncbi:MAG: ribonuclease III [Actinomycetota bacterium]